jgi:hypothetical protein
VNYLVAIGISLTGGRVMGKDKDKGKDLQEGIEDMILALDGERIGDKKFDMTKAVKKEGDKGKGKSK